MIRRWSDDEVRRRVSVSRTLGRLWGRDDDIAATGMVVACETAETLGEEVLALRESLRDLVPHLIERDERGAMCVWCGAAYGPRAVEAIDVPHSASCAIGRALRVLRDAL